RRPESQNHKDPVGHLYDCCRQYPGSYPCRLAHKFYCSRRSRPQVRFQSRFLWQLFSCPDARHVHVLSWRPAPPVWEYDLSLGLRQASRKSARENILPGVLFNHGNQCLSGSHADGTGFLLTSYRRELSYQRCLGSVLHLQSHCAHNVGSRPCAHLFSAPAHGPPPRLGFPTRVVFSTDFLWPKTARCKRGVLGSCGRIPGGNSLGHCSSRLSPDRPFRYPQRRAATITGTNCINETRFLCLFRLCHQSTLFIESVWRPAEKKHVRRRCFKNNWR